MSDARPPLPPFAATWPAVPDSVPTARRAVVAYLREAATPDPPLGDVALVVSEAVTNAVQHAYVGRPPGHVNISVEVDEQELAVTVEDDGAGLVPRADSPGLGLGLPLIATVAARFETRTRPQGGTRLCVWFRRDAGAAALPA